MCVEYGICQSIWSIWLNRSCWFIPNLFDGTEPFNTICLIEYIYLQMTHLIYLIGGPNPDLFDQDRCQFIYFWSSAFVEQHISGIDCFDGIDLQLDCWSATRTRIINLPTNQKGYDTFETTVGKLSARRIRFCPVYFCLGIILKVILNNFQNNA